MKYEICILFEMHVMMLFFKESFTCFHTAYFDGLKLSNKDCPGRPHGLFTGINLDLYKACFQNEAASRNHIQTNSLLKLQQISG